MSLIDILKKYSTGKIPVDFFFKNLVSLIQIRTGVSQSHHHNLPLANQNQSRSQQNYNPYIDVIIT